ncbi:MAG: hypothetical protein JRI72_16365 [Deltaproteobacteria bacterium]|nr:hypothetical protein [Deltaproteobacteria bacterium]
MKLNLAVPGNSSQRLLFSNIGNENKREFYLLMTFHKSRRGGFDYPVTIEECKKALAKKGYCYIERR